MGHALCLDPSRAPEDQEVMIMRWEEHVYHCRHEVMNDNQIKVLQNFRSVKCCFCLRTQESFMKEEAVLFFFFSYLWIFHKLGTGIKHAGFICLTVGSWVGRKMEKTFQENFSTKEKKETLSRSTSSLEAASNQWWLFFVQWQIKSNSLFDTHIYAHWRESTLHFG